MSARFLLYRRNGTYYFRWSIPLALRRRMATGMPADVRLSLRTAHFPTARELAARHWAAALDIRNMLLVAPVAIGYKGLLDAIRGRVLMGGAATANGDGDGLVSLVELAGTAELQRLVDTLALLDARGAEFFIEVPPVGVTVWVRGYDDEGDVSEDILEALDDFADPAARLTREGIKAALAAQRNLFEVAELYSDQVGMWRGSEARREYHRVVPAPAFTANLSAIKVASSWRSSLDVAPIPAVAAAAPAQAKDCDPILLSLGRDAWVRVNSRSGGGAWSKSTQDNYGAAISQFIDIVGDKLTTELTADDFAVYEKVMRGLPSNWAATRRSTNLSFAEIALQGADKPKVSSKTLKDKGGAIGTFFQYLKDNGYWHGRYGKALFGTVKLKSSRRVRHTFTDADLQAIFSGRGMDAMRKAKFPLYIWGTILLLYTGARPAEVSQLKRQDVMQDAEGTWYLQFREEEDEEEGGPSQSLKTEASFRAVPLHPVVLELGFLSFIRRYKPDDWLFPETFRHKQKVSREIGDWANNHLLTAAGLKAPGVVLYSLRHTVINRFKRDATAAYLACAYTGHATDADRPMTNREFVETYGKNFSPTLLARTLHPLLEYGIDWTAMKAELKRKRWD